MKKNLLAALFGIIAHTCFAKDTTAISNKQWEIPNLQWNISKDGSKFVRFNATAQIWTRWNQSNPGTIVENNPKPNTYDIGIRRLRLQVTAQPLSWMLLYVQFGINNFNSLSPRKAGDFFHDAIVEFTPVKRYFSIGAGLTGWTGSARFASPAAGSIMMYDAPLYQQSTNDITDQFLRKLSVYAKGKIQKLDYRIALSDPLSISTSPLFDTAYGNITHFAKITPKGKSLQTSGYFMYQIFDEENNLLPYTQGTYLGAKKIFNVGVGFLAQPKATWHLRNTDTLYNPMWQISADVYTDLPLNKRRDDCLSAYAAYSYYYFGPGFVRNLGVMNPATKFDASKASFNGAGNAYPIVGTGHTIFAQAGYKLPAHLFGTKGFSIMPYTGFQLSRWNRLNAWMGVVDAGVNFLLVGNKAKISLNYQNRPVFNSASLKQSSRANAVIAQWQIAL
jgi:hypothetical protein